LPYNLLQPGKVTNPVANGDGPRVAGSRRRPRRTRRIVACAVGGTGPSRGCFHIVFSVWPALGQAAAGDSRPRAPL